MRVDRLRATWVAALIALSAPLAGSAQPTDGGGAGSGSRSRGGGRGARLFDPKTVTTLQGEILEIEHVAHGRRSEGVHLMIAAGSEKLPVHLGPSFFVDRQGLKLAKGDRLEVKGSRVVLDGAPAVIAQEIKRGSETMVLRDANGFPVWAGKRGRNP